MKSGCPRLCALGVAQDMRRERVLINGVLYSGEDGESGR
jgi:hypothetical protein